MSTVKCEVEYTSGYDDNGIDHDCVKLTCERCGHQTMSWGDGPQSVNRCKALLKEQCTESESNFYVEE